MLIAGGSVGIYYACQNQKQPSVYSAYVTNGNLVKGVDYNGSASEPYVQITSPKGKDFTNKPFTMIGQLPGPMDGFTLKGTATDSKGRIFFEGVPSTNGHGDPCIQIEGETTRLDITVYPQPTPPPIVPPGFKTSLNNGPIKNGTDVGPDGSSNIWVNLIPNNFDDITMLGGNVTNTSMEEADAPGIKFQQQTISLPAAGSTNYRCFLEGTATTPTNLLFPIYFTVLWWYKRNIDPNEKPPKIQEEHLAVEITMEP